MQIKHDAQMLVDEVLVYEAGYFLRARRTVDGQARLSCGRTV